MKYKMTCDDTFGLSNVGPVVSFKEGETVDAPDGSSLDKALSARAELGKCKVVKTRKKKADPKPEEPEAPAEPTENPPAE